DAAGLAEADDPAFPGRPERFAIVCDLAPCQGATQSAVHSAGHGRDDVIQRRGDRRPFRDTVIVAELALHAVDDRLADVAEVGVAKATLVLQSSARDVLKLVSHTESPFGTLAGPSQRAHGVARVARLGTGRVVRVAVRRPDDAGRVDDKAGRYRQRPGGIAIERLEIERERAVDLTQVLREAESEAESCGHLVPAIGEDLEREVSMSGQLPVVLGQLR